MKSLSRNHVENHLSHHKEKGKREKKMINIDAFLQSQYHFLFPKSTLVIDSCIGISETKYFLERGFQLG